MQSHFRVVIFSGADAGHILRLVQRIHREVPEARVCGVLCERRGGKSTSTRAATFVRNLKDPDFIPYALSKVSAGLRDEAAKVGSAFLRFVHGGGPSPAREEDPQQILESLGCAFHITTDYHGENALQFVRGLNADLGIVYGTRILKPCLFSIPRLGSINIHKRKVPDYRGGGPVGLWELLDGQSEIGVTVHQVTEKLDAGAIINATTIPIQNFDSLSSLALKAHVVANDLIVRSVKDYARGTVNSKQQFGSGRMFKAPSAQRLCRLRKQIASSRPTYRPPVGRPKMKLLAKSLLALPRVTIRNWRRRANGTFPVTILFHHLIADRPHRMASSTDYFLKHIRFLQKYYDVVSLQQAIEMLQSNKVKRPTVVLTFDDGYGDNFINLRAIVEETGVPVTMFVSSDHINRGTPFGHDASFGDHDFLPLTWAELRQMQRDGFEIGSHTRTHFDCGSQDRTALQNEIAGSKADLEQHIGQPIQYFSFPFGLPENMSVEAMEIAARTYPYILSAFGGDNVPPANGVVRHLRRWSHTKRIWDLELLMQGALEEPRSYEDPLTTSEPAGPGTGRPPQLMERPVRDSLRG
jgi:peptidoglycan/xylan/chitin deacetylase (PgdA/CDA1 family)